MQKGKREIKEEKEKNEQEQINISKYPATFERCESWIHGKGSAGKKELFLKMGSVLLQRLLNLGPQNALMSSLRLENSAVGLATFET